MLNQQERSFALKLAHNTLELYLNEQQYKQINPEKINQLYGSESELLTPLGCFVTLKKDGQLRGCIGTIYSDEPLFQNIINNLLDTLI